MEEDPTNNVSADGGKNQEEEEEEEVQHHYDASLIPPFLLNQKVFTRNLEKRLPGPGGGAETNAATATKSAPTKQETYFEAVVKQVRHSTSTSTGTADRWTFLIHFKGWNARYDRWIAASQLVPDTAESRQIYAVQQQKIETKRLAEAEAQKQKQLEKKTKKRKQQQQLKNGGETGAATSLMPSESLATTLPFTLKTIMIEEWEHITRHGYDSPFGYDADMLQPTETEESNSNTNNQPPKGNYYPARSVHTLPSTVTMRQLLKHFEKKTRKDFEQKQEKEQRKAHEKLQQQQQDGPNTTNDDKEAQLAAATKQFKQQVRQFCNGLAKLFEEALPACLLYAQERPQYHHFVTAKRQDGEKVSVLDVYGCEFLLRLIVRLPILTLGQRPPALVSDLTVLLQQNRTACFKGKFRPPAYPNEWLDWEKAHFGDPT